VEITTEEFNLVHRCSPAFSFKGSDSGALSLPESSARLV
jgi:hypothetical protein